MLIIPSSRPHENPFYGMSRQTRKYRKKSAMRQLINTISPLAFAGIGFVGGGFDASPGAFIEAIYQGSITAFQSGISLPGVMLHPLFVLPSVAWASKKTNEALQFALRCWENVCLEVRDCLSDWLTKRSKDKETPERTSETYWLEDLHNAGITIVPKGAAMNAVEQLLRAHNQQYSKSQTDEVGIVVCDRKNLRRIEKKLRQFARKLPEAPISLFNDGNMGQPDVAAPALLTLNKDGSAHAVWADMMGQPYLAISYSRDGVPEHTALTGPDYRSSTEIEHLPPLSLVTERMRSSVMLRQDELAKLEEKTRFYRETHLPEVLDDGSVLIRDVRTGVVDNPYGPALITANGRHLYYKQGSVVDRPWKKLNEANYPKTESIKEYRSRWAEM